MKEIKTFKSQSPSPLKKMNYQELGWDKENDTQVGYVLADHNHK